MAMRLKQTDHIDYSIIKIKRVCIWRQKQRLYYSIYKLRLL